MMIALLILLVASSLSICLSDESVKFAAILYRHGDRTPVDPYPTDPYRNESLWPVRFGQLTNIGKMQHYKLGQWLRKRYSHLLSDEFDPTEIYIRSTDVDRTLMSAQANLAGMYPPTGHSKWNPNLMWQPIPIHTVPEHEDEVLAMMRPCPAYTELYQELINSKAYKERLSKYQKLMNYLSAYTGMKVKSYEDIISIYSNLYIEKLYNFTLPDWTKAVYPDKFLEPAGYSFRVDTINGMMSKLKIGPLLKEITSKMMKVVNGTNSTDVNKRHHKVLVFSGHDLTVASFLNGLGLYNGVCPVYTATVFVELVYNNVSNTHFIRISYRNSTEIVEPYVLNIPYCGQLCPVERFNKLYKNLLTVDWEKDCEIKISEMVLLLGVGIGVLLFLLYEVFRTNLAKVQSNFRKLENDDTFQ